VETLRFDIQARDFTGAGAASRALKQHLKRIGADAEAIRRTMIAAYEAEMNVVIHARDGAMRVAVDPEQVEVAVVDEGPGIPDIDRALTEGFSTAPAEARELGFGAGMGLPNIRKNSDRFTIHSELGRGTQIRFAVRLQPAQTCGTQPNSVSLDISRCRQCLRCLGACPTQAARVYCGRPEVLEHLCVDCTACAEACPADVFGFPAQAIPPDISPETVLVLPVSLLGQLGPGVRPGDVLEALASLGFHDVRVGTIWEDALDEAVRAYAAATAFPVLPPVCPAVVNLIRMRFPSLLPHIPPFLTPIEAAREAITGPHVVAVVPCPAQYTAFAGPNGLTRVDIVAPGALLQALLPRLKRHGRDAAAGALLKGEAAVRVGGMGAVTRFREEVENGQAADCASVALYACPDGCFGAPVWRTHPAMARQRAREALPRQQAPGVAVRRVRPLTPRAGLRLDADMRRAMRKLGEIDALTRQLPGRDCGVCGAPTCGALAEDIVRGRATIEACTFRETRRAGDARRESPHEAEEHSRNTGS